MRIPASRTTVQFAKAYRAEQVKAAERSTAASAFRRSWRRSRRPAAEI